MEDSFEDRTISLLWVVELLLEGLRECSGCEVHSSCGRSLSVPVPCVRDVWESRTNMEWKRQYGQYLSNRKLDKVLTVQDVLAAQEAPSDAQEHRNRDLGALADVARWYEGLDAFGMLIWTILPFHRSRWRNAGS
jgi:hypothetical protein